MSEKRFFLMKKFLGKDKFHDIICHKIMDSKETEETLNLLYDKYSSLKKENEQLKLQIKELEKENKQSKMIEKYYVVHYYQENGFTSTEYVIKTFKSKTKADFYAQFMNKEDKDAMYFVYERKFDD